MAFSFDLLPTELQASVLDLRAAGAPSAVIDTLVERTLAALVTKSNKVQVQVWQIEEHLGQRLEQIGLKLQADLQTQHGETNGMLMELRQAQQIAHPQVEEALAGIVALKKAWGELEDWRGRVEAAIGGFMESRDLSLAERNELKQAVETLGLAVGDLGARVAVIEEVLELKPKAGS